MTDTSTPSQDPGPPPGSQPPPLDATPTPPPTAAATAAPAPVPPPAVRRIWRRWWFPYLFCAILGISFGFGYAVHLVRAGALGSGERIGAWETGRDFATAEQSARTRAVVALRGLLALPASEARYYTARFDDAGQPLTGNCTYRVTGGALAAQFWTMTLYDEAGYLVPNPAGIYSVGNMVMSPAERARWTIIVSPAQQPGRWLPTGVEPGTAARAVPIALTLRAYLPADGGKGNFTAAQLPAIRKEGCI